MSSEVETMFYAGETPWHRLGTKVAGLQTAEEAISVSGLDWDVELVSIFSHWKRNKKMIPDRHALRRVTDGKVFNVVGNRYVPIQNREAFRFFDSVIGTGQAVYETAGSLMGGSRVWVMANLNGDLDISGDTVKRYLTLTMAHDGTGALQMWFTPVRTVCWNTLQMALSRGVGERFYARHTSGFTQKVDSAQQILGITEKYYSDFKTKAQWMAQYHLPEPDVDILLKHAFGYDESKEKIYAPIQLQMDKAKNLITTGRGQDNPAIQGTAWQAYNGIVEFADYYLPVRSKSEDARLQSLAFGTGSQIKARAWNHLLKVA